MISNDEPLSRDLSPEVTSNLTKTIMDAGTGLLPGAVIKIVRKLAQGLAGGPYGWIKTIDDLLRGFSSTCHELKGLLTTSTKFLHDAAAGGAEAASKVATGIENALGELLVPAFTFITKVLDLDNVKDGVVKAMTKLKCKAGELRDRILDKIAQFVTNLVNRLKNSFGKGVDCDTIIFPVTRSSGTRKASVAVNGDTVIVARSPAVRYEELPPECRKKKPVQKAYQELLAAREEYQSKKSASDKSMIAARRTAFEKVKQKAEALAQAIADAECGKGCPTLTAEDMKAIRDGSPEETLKLDDLYKRYGRIKFMARDDCGSEKCIDPGITDRNDGAVRINKVHRDHIYPLNTLIVNYGHMLACLFPDQRLEVANNLDNLFPVSEKVNCSRADNSWEVWIGVKGKGSDDLPEPPCSRLSNDNEEHGKCGAGKACRADDQADKRKQHPGRSVMNMLEKIQKKS